METKLSTDQQCRSRWYIDELLNKVFRYQVTKYKKAEKDLDDRNGWGEINFSTFKRKQNNQDLTLGFNLTGVTLNLINL